MTATVFRMKKSILWIFVLFCFASACARVQENQVLSVADGDTLTIYSHRKKVKIRLAGIDCPELSQPYGKIAKRFVQKVTSGRVVSIEKKTRDQYGRVVAFVFIDDKMLNEMMVDFGYAWVYRKYCNYDICSRWARLEAIARKQRKGLWLDSRPIAPWEWRRIQRNR